MYFIFINALALPVVAETANPIAEFNAIKAKNARVLTGCLDFKAQSPDQRAHSGLVRASLRLFLSERITAADRRRWINGNLDGVATGPDHVVLVFSGANVPLERLPEAAWRSDHRRRLEDLVSQWQSDLNDPTLKLLVRFNDECDIPVVDWK